MLYVVLVAAMLICGVFAVRATHLLTSALWLAGTSVVTALILYLIGAYTIAVLELSLSVGLITILLVFAISMVGANSPDQPLSRWTDVLLVTAMLLLIVGSTVPALVHYTTTTAEASFAVTLWHERQVDVLTQIALIFSGVLGVLGLLSESHSTARNHQQSETRQDQGQVSESTASWSEQAEDELEHI